MAKKGLITSLILGAVLTLSLGVYTLVTAIVALTTPVHTSYSYAYTSEQTITAFSKYSTDDGNLEIQYAEGQEDCLIFAEDNTCVVDTEKEFFANAQVGDSFSIKAIATTDKYGSTETYNVTVYKQGTGSAANDAYSVANTEGLVALADKMNNYDAADTTNVIGGLLTDDVAGNGFVSLVASVDLTDVEWKGLATNYARPFNDVFNGNGYVVDNMSIHITAQNYQDYLGTLTDNVGSYTGLSVGFFRNTNGATINGLSLTNANIVIDTDVLALINPTEGSTLEFVRVGLLVGDARNTTINGLYTEEIVSTKVVLDTTEGSETFGQEIEVEEVTYVDHTSSVSGSINGYAYGKFYDGEGYSVNGLGGLAGVIHDISTGSASEVANYAVDLTVTNANNQDNIYIGAVAGEILAGYNTISLEELDVKLTSSALFNNRNHIGAVAGSVNNITANEITTTLVVSDNNKTLDQFVAWHNNATERDLGQLTDVAGIAAVATNSIFDNVYANATIDIYANASAGFIFVEDSTLSNVITNGRVTGYSATGLAQFLYNSNVTYIADAEEELVASNTTLSGWYSAGLADYAKNSNITATGLVKVNVTINAKGGIENKDIQNTLHSAGLVGYFYTTDTTFNNEYLISGFKVNATMYNVTDAAGLVAYLGNNSASAEETSQRLVVSNCEVVSNITSNTSLEDCTTHKVGGAVATIYGLSTLDNVNVTVCFNPNQIIGNKYGAAMFGGLVARIGGEYVTINNCPVVGDAYINYTAYAKSYGESEEYEQILAGGLVGAIASFGKTIEAGKHPVYGENTNDILESATYDNMFLVDTTTIAITNNNVAVNITIDIAKEVVAGAETCMEEEGYRARATGSLIGLVMNGKDTNSDGVADVTTALDLSTNVVSGTISADRFTFTFHSTATPQVGLSSMGYGNVNASSENPACVGASFDLVTEKQYKVIVFPPVVEETPAA